MIDKLIRARKVVLAVVALLAVASVFFVFRLQFSFDFEQFFPDGDEDLTFFRDFIDEFEADDNFMLVAVRRPEGVFEQAFLEDFHEFSLQCRELPYVEDAQSLTQFAYPLKTPFGLTTVPAIHIDQPERYETDRARLLADERFASNLISKDATTLVVFIKTKPSIELEEARGLMKSLDSLTLSFNFPEHHYLGRAYFQKELVAMQIREVVFSAVVSGILVALIMFWIFRRTAGIIIALSSIGLGMLFFFGWMGAVGRELNAMSALYPVLMIIVGTSDVIHIISKYIDELRKGKAREEAIKITIREIGMATLLTSVTTAVGFASLLSSRIIPIRDFGLNAAAGVMIAYLTVIFFTTAVLSYMRADQLIKFGRSDAFWNRLMAWTYQFTLHRQREIVWGTAALVALCAIGISQVTTNYNLSSNMPTGRKITEDFLFFENNLTGFRPLEFAIYTGSEYKADDYAVVKEVDKIERHLRTIPGIEGIGSITTIYKSINQAMNSNQASAYVLPDTEAKFEQYQRFAEQLPKANINVLISRDREKTRITSRVMDMGADTLKYLGQNIDQWIKANTDPDIIQVKRTGTGMIIDKNAEYVRKNLLEGLTGAIIIVALLMVLLFRNFRMLFIALVPNLIPLLMAGALLGYLNIELEAGISIVFAVIFGIAVDDSIHFLGKYKLALLQGKTMEQAIEVTFMETGKAICLTSIILFFGFLVMLFSIHPPSVTIGLLISLTLVGALFSDLLLLPLLIRWFMPVKTVAVATEEASGVAAQQEI